MAAGFNSDLNFDRKMDPDDKVEAGRLDKNNPMVVDSHDVYCQKHRICTKGEVR